MSLGFLTESALLPSQSKEIKVDSSSIFDLKAIVYQKEKELEKLPSGTRKRRVKQKTPDDYFNKRNKGIEERMKQDEDLDESEKSKLKMSYEILKKKAELYDRLKKDASLVPNDTFLVNFDEKEKKMQDEMKQSIGSNDPEYVEIEDEFGRCRSVKRNSEEHKAYLEAVKTNSKSSSLVHETAGDSSTTLNGYVVSQWEKTLRMEEKAYLQQVHEETVNVRSTMSSKRQKKEERLKKLRDRQQSRTDTQSVEAQATAFLSDLL